MLCQFTDYTLWVSTWFINLVNRNNDWNTSSLRVVDGFNSLWHNTVIRSDNQDSNICNRSTTGTHRCKGRVSWSIKEGDFLTTLFNLVGTNMLCDTTSFSSRNTWVTKGIKKGCFTMVNVSHDSNNWCTFYHSIFIEVVFVNKETFDISIIDFFFLGCFNTVVNHQQLNSIPIKRLVLSCHNTHHEEFLNDFSWLTFNTFCDFCNRHAFSVFKFFW